MKTIIETARLRLREMTIDDLDFIAGLLGDPEVMRFYPRPRTRAEAEEWVRRQLERYEQDGHGLWLVEDRQSGECYGQVGITMQDIDSTREPEVGYLIHKPFWRRGYATEAALASRDYAFRERGYPYVTAIVRVENEPSRAVARKLGMTPWKQSMRAGMDHIIFRVDSTPQG
jgi:[ribosomal protein S5]-alanine N-acetyltransferase